MSRCTKIQGQPWSNGDRTGVQIVAIDWSGSKGRAARNKIWTASANNGRVKTLENGRNREETVAHVISMAKKHPQMIVGLDFAFSFPLWFLRRKGVHSVTDCWELVSTEAEGWLAASPFPFWGRRKGHRPRLPNDYRRTEESLSAFGPARPKSVFQIGGAGAVGTASLRGMPFLKRLRDSGFNVWPFCPPHLPLVVEIYPRTLTGNVVKSRLAARTSFLDTNYPGLGEQVRRRAASTEDAFDAAVSALVMDKHREELLRLPRITTIPQALEGEIWTPGFVAPAEAR